jgi:hypothetical protein
MQWLQNYDDVVSPSNDNPRDVIRPLARLPLLIFAEGEGNLPRIKKGRES